MGRLLLQTLLVWACAFAASAQLDGSPEADNPVGGSPEERAGAPDDTDLISRVNAEMDRNAIAGETDTNSPFSSGQPADGFQQFLRGLFALCIVLALILLAYYGVRKWGKRVPMLAGVSLGSVLGRIHLDRGTALHFVRTGGRVLLIGVNGNSISLVADFDEVSFDELQASKETPEKEAESLPFNPDSFLAQLQTSSNALKPSSDQAEAPVDDDEISALRGDIQRLQKYLREESRESQD